MRIFIYRHRLAAGMSLAVIATLADVVTTAVALTIPGLFEANPLGRELIDFGWHGVVAYKLATLAVIGAVIAWRALGRYKSWQTAFLLALPTGIYGTVAVHNLALIVAW